MLKVTGSAPEHACTHAVEHRWGASVKNYNPQLHWDMSNNRVTKIYNFILL